MTAERRWYLTVAGVLAAVYLPLVLRTYGWGDDYALMQAANDPHGSFEHVLQGARPLYALALDISFGFTERIGDLAMLRVISTVGVIAVGALAYWCLRRSAAPRATAAALAVAICLLPTFQTFAAWASTWPYSWACLAAGMASILLSRAATRAERRAWHVPAATALVIAAFLLYQPAAMFVWFPLGTWLALEMPAWSRARPVCQIHAIVVGIALLLGYVIARIAMEIASLEILSRASVIRPDEVPAKVAWFVSRPLVLGARTFSISSPSPVEAALTAGPILLAIGLGLVLRARARPQQATLVALVALVPLAMLPNLVIGENQIEHRLLVSLAPLVVVLMAGAARPLLALRPVVVALWLVVAVAAALAVHNTHQLFIDPSVVARAELASQLERFDPQRHDRIAVIVPEGWGSRRNIGIYSATTDLTLAWVPGPLVEVLLAERGIELSPANIDVSSEHVRDPRTFVLDTTPIQRRLVGTPR